MISAQTLRVFREENRFPLFRISEDARANVMRGMIARATRLHGEHAVPAFVLRNIGLIAAT
ncbi:hypothetical protein AAFX91_17165 [Bradyrhizobium sp. 31Argb]|uniref:hypothetical protein n=1 Tax=unclassified Bradyrhizobium TaxID=2631580 RepID=UPI00102E84EC|nr:hypothetical protein [Bradyrhizobium sp. Leo170]TAI66628.1 hypothetical protein CWO89_07040 [Bradyrhizobium sp. Leo170]